MTDMIAVDFNPREMADDKFEQNAAGMADIFFAIKNIKATDLNQSPLCQF
ncbi:hypothetical protein [Dyadobacter frigoris]|nr:hypothetical protein [Dyadobacter frigoris]